MALGSVHELFVVQALRILLETWDEQNPSAQNHHRSNLART
jgi:hypothetical protein